jgi:hypothetical protein
VINEFERKAEKISMEAFWAIISNKHLNTLTMDGLHLWKFSREYNSDLYSAGLTFQYIHNCSMKTWSTAE